MAKYFFRLTAAIVLTLIFNDANADAPSISYASPQVYTTGTAISSLSPTNTGGTATSYSISPSLPGGLGFSTTTGVISGTPTATSPATNYTVTATNGSGSGNTIINITVGSTVAWTAGSSTTDWATGGNWSTGTPPDATDNVSIGVSAYINPFEPSITAANVSVNSLTFGAGHACVLTVRTGTILTINNSLTVNSGATTTLTGTGTGAIRIAPAAIVNINGTGVLTITSPLNFTLMSDATGSASIGQILSTSITGTGASSINVQRYITGGSAIYRGYRLFSSPVYASTISGDNVYKLNYVQASALVTGSAGGGFDLTGNPSLYLFRENIASSNTTFTGGNFRGVSSLLSAPVYSFNGEGSTYSIPVANGFMLFFRGDRTSNVANKYTPGTSAESVTMTSTGTLNSGQIVVNNWYSPSSVNLAYSTTAGNSAVRGLNLVGNPYACSIDWDSFQSSTSTSGIYGQSMSSTIYMLNPANQNYGAYTQGNSGVGTNNASNIIASGQGFFVVAGNSSATLTFNESAKTTTQNTGLNLFMGKPVNTASIRYLRLQLAKDSVNTDDLMLGFNNNASTAYNAAMDAAYLPGFGQVSLSSFSSDKKSCAVNVQPLPKTSATIGLKILTKTDGIYSLNMKNVAGIPQLYDIWLMDAYKKDSLDMRHNATYSFNVLKSDTNTFGSNRFSLVIRQNPAYVYRLLNFSAAKISGATAGAKQVQLVWQTENEQNYTNFTVERSIDTGKTFQVIGGMVSTGAGAYSLVDNAPLTGTNLYRLRQEDINNAISYSNIANVMYSIQNNVVITGNLSIYPNPAINNINLTITKKSQLPAFYDVIVANSSGTIVKRAKLSQPSWQTGTSDLRAGTYMIQVVNASDKSMVGQIKFVKL